MAPLTPRDLLLSEQLDTTETAALLARYGFRDVARADANLQAMADDPWTRQLLSEIIDDLLFCLAGSPNPDQALDYFERFSQATLSRAGLFSYLKEAPQTLRLLSRTFGGSQFLAEILIRNPLYLYWIADPEVLNHSRDKDEISRDLVAELRPLKTEQKKLDTLRIFRRKEILHIGVRDLLRLSTVDETVRSLSHLAEVLIEAACRICRSEMRRAIGVPFYERDGRKVPTGFTVLAMGKLGGEELNFSSDVDLVYLFETDQGHIRSGRKATPAGEISTADYFERLSRKITHALAGTTNEGYVYRVDLRLRPEGRAGNIAYSLRSFRTYYRKRGATWERLALLKAWPIAGDRKLGMKFLAMVSPFIYGRPFDVEAINEITKIKAQIDQKVTTRGQKHRNVKLGFGGIREIELIVQCLQITFGKAHPETRERNTIKALKVLERADLISPDECRSLHDAYMFLRDVENKLQIVLDSQTHSLPAEPAELRACALRLGYRDEEKRNALDCFLEDLKSHTTRVNAIFRTFFSEGIAERFKRSGT